MTTLSAAPLTRLDGSHRLTASAPPEERAYVVTLNTGTNGDRRPDALTVVDLKPGSSTYGTTVGRLEMPNVGDELHHFGWNACSSALCPWAPHPHVERRYLLVPGLRSSRMHVVDTKPDPRAPTSARTIEPEEMISRTGYYRPHTIHGVGTFACLHRHLNWPEGK